jgi:hypothetical protein
VHGRVRPVYPRGAGVFNPITAEHDVAAPQMHMLCTVEGDDTAAA